MSGRGDNNKNGTSGSGESNQSMQGHNPDHEKAAHGKKTGGERSQPQEQDKAQSANRNTSVNNEKK